MPLLLALLLVLVPATQLRAQNPRCNVGDRYCAEIARIAFAAGPPPRAIVPPRP